MSLRGELTTSRTIISSLNLPTLHIRKMYYCYLWNGWNIWSSSFFAVTDCYFSCFITYNHRYMSRLFPFSTSQPTLNRGHQNSKHINLHFLFSKSVFFPLHTIYVGRGAHQQNSSTPPTAGVDVKWKENTDTTQQWHNQISQKVIKTICSEMDRKWI